MVDPKATNKKAQDILKSMQINYDDSGNITITYFEALEKTLFDWARKRKSTTNKPEVADHPIEAAPAPPEPPKPSQEAGMPPVEPPKKPENVISQPQPKVPIDALHQAREVVAPQPPKKFVAKQHALDKIKRLMEGGATNENGKIEVSPEQASFTLEPLVSYMNKIGDDDAAIMDALEFAADFAKDRATNPENGVINPLYSPRAVQIFRQSMIKRIKASPDVRNHILKRYETLVPFTPEEKKADPVIEAMNKDFKEIFNMSGVEEGLKDRVRLKSLGAAVGGKFLKYINDDYAWLDNKQLERIINAAPGSVIRGREGAITEEYITTAAHELRVRKVIQQIQNFLWDNYNITTYLGSSMFGNSVRAKVKREHDIPKLKANLQQLTEELERGDIEEEGMIGKSVSLMVDFSEFPEPEEENDSTYFVVRR